MTGQDFTATSTPTAAVGSSTLVALNAEYVLTNNRKVVYIVCSNNVSNDIVLVFSFLLLPSGFSKANHICHLFQDSLRILSPALRVIGVHQGLPLRS